jgi:hypothetical protein
VCPYLLPPVVLSILPCLPSTAQRSMCELIVGKDTCDENWPFTTSHKHVAVRIRHRPLSHVARGCRTTRHSPFLAPVMLPLTLLFDHPRRAEPPWTDWDTGLAQQPLLNIVLRPSPTSGRNAISQSVATRDCRRDIVRSGAVATGVPHPLMDDGCSLCTVGPRRAGRRCRTPPGTASPDAVPPEKK